MTEKLPNKFGPWVVGDDFFDRTSEIERLTQLLDEGNSILLVAPRRIGKTSLVRETFRRMEQRDEDYLLFVDVQDCKTPEDVIVAISMAAQPYGGLASKVKEAFSSFFRGLSDKVESVGSSAVFELRLREGLTGDWQMKADKIMASLAQADRPVAICLDELPIMVNRLVTGPGDQAERRELAEVFLSWLRKTVSAHAENIRWIVCGSIGLEPILARHNLSFTTGHLRPFHLPTWDRETAAACVESLSAHQGHEWPRESRDALLDKLAHFVPHHVQMYFGHVIDDCRLRGVQVPTEDDVLRVYKTHMLSTRGHAELADYEERLLRVLDEATKELALALLTEAAVAGRLTLEASRRIAESHGLEHPERARRDVLRVLEHDGYLTRGEKDDHWRFLSSLIRDWWYQRFGTGYVPFDQEEV